MSEPVELRYPERFRFDSPWLGLRLWREPRRTMWLEAIIRESRTRREPDECIGYWIKFEGLFPKRLDELLGETTTFQFRVDLGGLIHWYFESVVWMEGWDNMREHPVIVGHAHPVPGASSNQYVREQVGDVDRSLAAWWREPEE